MTGKIFIFQSMTQVFLAEDLLEEAIVDFEIIPVPKAINPNCGMAIFVSQYYVNAALMVLREADISKFETYDWTE